MNDFGKRLAIFRSRRKVSKTALAKMTGIDRANLAKIERGATQNPMEDTRARIASGFGLSYEDFEKELAAIFLPVDANESKERLITAIRKSSMPPDYLDFLRQMVENWRPSTDQSLPERSELIA